MAFLGYALWVTLKHLLKRRAAIISQPSASGVHNALRLSPIKVLALLSTMQSADIVLPTTDGHEIRLRRIAEPEPEQKALLQQLGLSLPERFVLNRKFSAWFPPMIKGLDKFQVYLAEHHKAFVLIGGVACHEWLSSQGLQFRATKDIDVVLVIEAFD